MRVMVSPTTNSMRVKLLWRWLSHLTMLLRLISLYLVVWWPTWPVRENIRDLISILCLVVCSSDAWVRGFKIREIKGFAYFVGRILGLLIISWLPFGVKFVNRVILGSSCHHRGFSLLGKRLRRIWYMLVWDISYRLKEMLCGCRSRRNIQILRNRSEYISSRNRGHCQISSMTPRSLLSNWLSFSLKSLWSYGGG